MEDLLEVTGPQSCFDQVSRRTVEVKRKRMVSRPEMMAWDSMLDTRACKEVQQRISNPGKV